MDDDVEAFVHEVLRGFEAMWSSGAQIKGLEGRRGPGLAMPVLLPLLAAAVFAVWGLYGTALSRTVDSLEGTTRTSLQISVPARGLQ